MKIPIKYIVELGLIRKKDVCAKCKSKMENKEYNIQLCKKCRLKELENYAKEIRPEHVLCVVCKNPIHIDSLAMISKKGMYHKNCISASEYFIMKELKNENNKKEETKN